MLKIGFILLMMPNVLNGLFGSYETHVQKINDDLKQAEQALDQGAYQLSFEKVKGAEDEFNYIRTTFHKKNRQKWMRLMAEFENQISILNVGKSKQALREVEEQWERLKKSVSLIETYG